MNDALKLLEQKLKELHADLHGAHSKSHLTITANLTQLIGKIYHYSKRELFLCYFAALFHDIVRSPAEDSQIDDKKLSAQMAVKLSRPFQTTKKEKEAIFYAIENHGHHPKWMDDARRRENLPQSLKERLHFALYVADKIEQNGVRMIARRSAFVAGERLNKQNGDLRDFGFKPKQDELLVVAIETVIRLTFINPESIYPEKLKRVVHPLYQIHRQFVGGLLKALNLTVDQISQKLLETKRSDGKNLLQVRGLDVIDVKVAITNGQIQKTSRKLVKASKEAVDYFSKRCSQDIDQLMLNWRPQSKVAQNWQRQMVEYLDGTWLNSITIQQ